MKFNAIGIDCEAANEDKHNKIEAACINRHVAMTIFSNFIELHVPRINGDDLLIVPSSSLLPACVWQINCSDFSDIISRCDRLAQ